MSDYRSFYDQQRLGSYGQDTIARPEEHSSYTVLLDFVRKYDLEKGRCLEIGSAAGAFQNVVEDYWGTDIAASLARNYNRPFRVAGVDGRYPFRDEMFDAIWTIHAFEHIPELQTALLEIKRMLKPGGHLLFSPAWQCRPWAAKGYSVRPFSDFDWKGKLIKASIPIRDSVFCRLMFVAPKRLVRQVHFLAGYRYIEIPYKKIEANYEEYWTSDSDACNSIDPHDAILWFQSNGFTCLSHPTTTRALTVRNGALVFKRTGDGAFL